MPKVKSQLKTGRVKPDQNVLKWLVFVRQTFPDRIWLDYQDEAYVLMFHWLASISHKLLQFYSVDWALDFLDGLHSHYHHRPEWIYLIIDCSHTSPSLFSVKVNIVTHFVHRYYPSYISTSQVGSRLPVPCMDYFIDIGSTLSASEAGINYWKFILIYKYQREVRTAPQSSSPSMHLW